VIFCVPTRLKLKTGDPPKMDEQTPPNHLSKATAEWWSSVMADYALEPHHIRLLTLACEAFDSAQDAREILQREGKIYIDRFDQPKPRPEVAIQRDSAIGFARMLRELDLDISGPTDRARPPALASNRAL
jgi:phage terminase small subunit